MNIFNQIPIKNSLHISISAAGGSDFPGFDGSVCKFKSFFIQRQGRTESFVSLFSSWSRAWTCSSILCSPCSNPAHHPLFYSNGILTNFHLKKPTVSVYISFVFFFSFPFVFIHWIVQIIKWIFMLCIFIFTIYM